MLELMTDLFPVLAESAARSTALLAVAGVAAVALRRASAAFRHLVWALALAGVLAMPILTLVVPRVGVPLGVAAVWVSASAGAAGPGVVDGRPALGEVARDAVTGDEVAGTRTLRSPVEGGIDSPAPAPAHVHDPAPAAWSGSGALAPLLMALWLAGVVVLLSSVLAGWRAVRRLEARTGPLADTHVAHLVTRLALRIGLQREVRLVVGPPAVMPMTWGIARPVIQLPEEWCGWPESRLEAVLLHELAHVARRDCLTQLLAEVARAIHWFNPLAWIAARRLRVEREHACDDVALAGGARPSDYAAELLGLALTRRASRATTLAAVAMARPGQLSGRLLAVLDEERNRRRLGRRALVRAAGPALALTLAVAALAPAEPAGAGDLPMDADLALSRIMGSGASFAGPGGPTAPASSGYPVVPSEPTSLNPATEPAPAPPAVQETCAAATDGWRNITHHSNDDTRTIRMSRPGCELEIRLEGEVELDGEAMAIRRLGSGARVRIEEDDGRERRLDITPGRDGAQQVAYTVDGRQAAFDGQAQAWYRAVLLQLFRRTGFAAEERVEALLRQGGPAAVLRELDLLDSSHVYALYARMLLDRAQLEEGEVRAIVRTAARRVDSDHYMAEVLGAVGATQPLTASVLDEFIVAAATLDSDHYRSEVLTGVLGSERLSPRHAAAVLDVAADMDSDHYRTELLKSVAARYARESAVRQAYLRAATSIDSDHYRTEVLNGLLERSDLSAAELAEVLRLAGTLSSDHYRGTLLERVAARGLGEPAMQRAYFEALRAFGSDHYRQQALRPLVDAPRLPTPLVAAVIAAAAEIGSDHYRSELLVAIAQRHALDGEAREAFMRAMEGIGSSHYRGQVADALLRAERR